MGGHVEGNIISRQDALVQQLLDERRRRLHSKMCQDSEVWYLSQGGPAIGDLAERSCGTNQDFASRQSLDTMLATPTLPIETEYTHVPVYAGQQSTVKETTSVLHREGTATLPEAAWTTAGTGCSSSSCSDPANARNRAVAPRPQSAPPMRTSKHRQSMESASGHNQNNFGTKLHEWTLRHQAFKDRQQQARQEKEDKEMEKCTFRPAINSRSQFYAQRSRGSLFEPLAERLHHEADKRSTLRHKAKELLEADDMCSYTFHPQINPDRSNKEVNHTPIHLRAEAIRQMKEERSRAMQTAKNVSAECSFQPRISGRSEQIVQKKREKLYRSLSQGDGNCLKFVGPVEERLYAEAQASEERRAARQDCFSETSQSNPSVDEESKRICRSSIYFQGAQQDFLTRQQTFNLAKQRRMELRAHHAKSKCSFQPKISDTSRQIVSFNIDFVGETTEDRVNRLAVKDVERRNHLRGQLEQIHYQDCTFKPAVNSASQILASKLEASDFAESGPSPVHERLYRSALEKLKSTDNSHEEEEYSFKPQMDPKSAKRFAHVKAHYASSGSGVMENIQEDLERKEEHLMEYRCKMEEQQKNECTFTPASRKSYEEPHRPVVVSGLNRFFELKGIALRQQQEKQERETRVFRPEQSNTHCSGVTIPEPFDLSNGRSDDSCRKKNTREWMQRLDACNFNPHTNESANREIIQQVLNSTIVDDATAFREFGSMRPHQTAY